MFWEHSPSSGASDVELHHMVLCTEFLDGWWSWEPLHRSCVWCGLCRATTSAPHTQPTQRLSRPPPIQKLRAENHMLQLNIYCSWWWAYIPETCRAKNRSIKLPCCTKLAFHIISSRFICEILWDVRTTGTVTNLLEFCSLFVDTSVVSWHSELVHYGLQLIWRVYFNHYNSDKTWQWQIWEVFAYIELSFNLRNYASRIVKVPCGVQWDNRITVLLTQTEKKCLRGKRQWIISR